MTVLIQSGFTPSIDITHARILHSENWRKNATVTASSTATGYDADAADNSLTYERWKPSSIIATLQFEYSFEAYANCVCIAAHTLGSSGCTFSIGQSDDGISWTSVMDGLTVDDDSPIMLIFEGESHYYWRIRITAGSAPEIGVIKFGGRTNFPRPIYAGNTLTPVAKTSVLRSNYSETGEVLGRSVKRSYLTASHEWRHLTEAWIRSTWPDLQTGIEAEPFFIAWRPENGDCAYAQTDQVPVPQTMGIRDLMSVSLSYRAIAYE